MLVDLTVKEFLNKVAGSDPVPGGGSIAALNGAIASALAAMVANLTIGKKGYELHEELIRHISGVALQQKEAFVADIDRCYPALWTHTHILCLVASVPRSSPGV